MTRIETIERQIQELSPEDLASLRQWFMEFDAEAWDRQFEKDSAEGKLDALAGRAIRHHSNGKTTKF